MYRRAAVYLIDLLCPVPVQRLFLFFFFSIGLHLLHREGQWKDISAALHRTVFLEIERSCCFARVVGRKVANGRSRASSEEHFSRVDGPVFDQLQEEKQQATLVLSVRPTADRPLRILSVDARLAREEPGAVP